MFERIKHHNMSLSRYPESIARYFMLSHKKDQPSPERLDLLDSARKRFPTDGLNSLKYKLIDKQYRLLYTWMLVSFEEKKRTQY